MVTSVLLTQRQSDNNVINGSYSNIYVVTTSGFMVEAYDNNLHMTINTATRIATFFQLKEQGKLQFVAKKKKRGEGE